MLWGPLPRAGAVTEPERRRGHGTCVAWVLGLSYLSVWGSRFSSDLSPMDGISTCSPKEEATLRVVVRMPPQHIIRGVRAAGGGGTVPSEGAPRGIICPQAHALPFGLPGPEAAGVLPGLQQGQRQGRLEDARRGCFPGVPGEGRWAMQTPGSWGPSTPRGERVFFPRGFCGRAGLSGRPSPSPALPASSVRTIFLRWTRPPPWA